MSLRRPIKNKFFLSATHSLTHSHGLCLARASISVCLFVRPSVSVVKVKAIAFLNLFVPQGMRHPWLNLAGCHAMQVLAIMLYGVGQETARRQTFLRVSCCAFQNNCQVFFLSVFVFLLHFDLALIRKLVLVLSLHSFNVYLFIYLYLAENLASAGSLSHGSCMGFFAHLFFINPQIWKHAILILSVIVEIFYTYVCMIYFFNSNYFSSH